MKEEVIQLTREKDINGSELSRLREKLGIAEQQSSALNDRLEERNRELMNERAQAESTLKQLELDSRGELEKVRAQLQDEFGRFRD